MEIQSTVIETGVDKLVNLIKERGRIPLEDAAKELGISVAVIQEWVDFLDEEGILSVEYKLAKPYLVERKLTKKEVETKAKEFATKKDVFVRKSEVNLNSLERQSQDLKKIKSEFDRLKEELGLELDKVRDELKELERYQQLNKELGTKLEQQKTDVKFKIEELIKDVLREQKRYKELVFDVDREKEELINERKEAKAIDESEKTLSNRLMYLKGIIDIVEKKLLKQNMSIKDSEAHIGRLDNIIEDIKKRIAEENSVIENLTRKSQEQEQKVLELQGKIIDKITQKQKNVANVSNIAKKVREFFEKKMAIVNLVDRINREHDELEKSLIDMIKKAKSFQLTAKSGDLGKEMIDLEKRFNDVSKKKSMFEAQIRELGSFFK